MDQKIEFDVNGLPVIETTYKGREGMRPEPIEGVTACDLCAPPQPCLTPDADLGDHTYCGTQQKIQCGETNE